LELQQPIHPDQDYHEREQQTAPCKQRNRHQIMGIGAPRR
jgi:hypothetical protein